MLDKGRAAVGGKVGEYKYACPLDQRFLDFVGIEAEALKKQLAAKKTDGEILDWINAHSKRKPSIGEILAWSMAQEQRGPTDVEGRDYFNNLHKKVAPAREDIATWFDLLDVDDYVSFGGRA
jgi:hypothetical protein